MLCLAALSNTSLLSSVCVTDVPSCPVCTGIWRTGDPGIVDLYERRGDLMRRLAARRLVRAFPDDLRVSTRRGLLDRLLFDRRGDRRGEDRDLRRAGMCYQ